MSYIIGIDVGGTNTNACLLQVDRDSERRSGHVVETVKIATDHDNLVFSTGQALKEICQYLPNHGLRGLEIHLSTTLITNTIIEGKGDSVTTLISSSPGLSLKETGITFPLYAVEGSIDHRGREITPLNQEKVREFMQTAREHGSKAVAVVGKFSPRNPQHELEIEHLIKQEFPEFSPVTLGHRLSGRLNFPRRIITSYLNAMVAGAQRNFASSIRQTLVQVEKDKITTCSPDIYLLKADGGTTGLLQSTKKPMETILSGPAASVMGTLSLTRANRSTVVILDIGGTTTDLSVMVDGEPLTEKDGALIGGFKTIIPALFSRSIGLGGDSAVRVVKGELRIGPERAGKAAALGGEKLTPTDALVVAEEEIAFGDRKRSYTVIKEFCRCTNYNASPQKAAQEIIDAFCRQAIAGINEIFTYLNSLPVYTVSEVLAPRGLKPEKLIGLGGPAAYFIPRIAALLKIPYEILPHSEAANAIGAAASQPTAAISLHADTALGRITVPELDYMAEIPRPLFFDSKKAEETAIECVKQYAGRIGALRDDAKFELVEKERFNLVRGFHTVGKIFSLVAQVKPETIRVIP